MRPLFWRCLGSYSPFLSHSWDLQAWISFLWVLGSRKGGEFLSRSQARWSPLCREPTQGPKSSSLKLSLRTTNWQTHPRLLVPRCLLLNDFSLRGPQTSSQRTHREFWRPCQRLNSSTAELCAQQVGQSVIRQVLPCAPHWGSKGKEAFPAGWDHGPTHSPSMTLW